MANEAREDIIGFGMTRKEISDAVEGIYTVQRKNDQDTANYSSYVESVKAGREAIKKHSRLYEYLPDES